MKVLLIRSDVLTLQNSFETRHFVQDTQLCTAAMTTHVQPHSVAGFNNVQDDIHLSRSFCKEPSNFLV